MTSDWGDAELAPSLELAVLGRLTLRERRNQDAAGTFSDHGIRDRA